MGAKATSKRKLTRGKKADENGVGDVFQEMLAEVGNNGPASERMNSRATKRRKLEQVVAEPSQSSRSVQAVKAETTDDVAGPASQRIQVTSSPSVPAFEKQQSVIRDTDSEDSESDADFEDVDLNGNAADSDQDLEPPAPSKPLKLDLSRPADTSSKSTTPRRKAATKGERALRLSVHKWHILCLLAHLQIRNHWCDDEQVQKTLKPLITRKQIKLLHVDESKLDFERNRSFDLAIKEICEMWKDQWTVTARGMQRAYWADEPGELDVPDDAEDPVDLEDFREAAKSRNGSRDLGAQLFCALLRSVAVETRLVCSLQTLPFSAEARGKPAARPEPKYESMYIYGGSPSKTTAPQVDTFNPRWRSSEHAFTSTGSLSSPSSSSRPNAQSKIKESPYPIFWAEVLSPVDMKYIPLDPLVRHTIAKPKTGFEPPLSDPLNSMSYVIAFSDDSCARDVTRRYVQFLNAKTRKTRVESTKHGERWWNKTMSFFAKPFPEPADEIEDLELAKREAQEPMPKSVQDFKGHPLYVLERHLRRNEVIFPKEQSGKVNVGTNQNGKLESVFRRKHVHVCRSADQWYRMGREVKVGERALKRVPKRRKDVRVMALADEDDEEVEEDAALYAEFQTNTYVPPPTNGSRVPRNAYGNLDIYVPTMIPAGAIHVQHPEAAAVAKALAIDFAEAVTGFDFKGRTGTARINGVVVAAQYRAAMLETIQALQHERITDEKERRAEAALRMWSKMLRALRVREHVEKEYGGNDADVEADEKDMDNESDDSDSEYRDEGGGFMPDADQVPVEKDDETINPMFDRPLHETEELLVEIEIIITESPHKLASLEKRTPGRHTPDDEEGGFVVGDSEGGFMVDETNAGGFIADEVEAAGFEPVGVERAAQQEVEITPTERSSGPTDKAAVDNAMDTGGGFFTEEPPDEITHSSKMPAREEVQPKAENHSTDTVTSRTEADGINNLQTSTAPPPQAMTQEPDFKKDVPVLTGATISESDEKGSLLSEDPEAAEADDWVMDDDDEE